MTDRYATFAELQAHERYPVDYRIRVVLRPSPVGIFAPHGGGIEAGTSEIAEAIAGDTDNLYCFEGLKRSGNGALHITSARFDEPKCLALLSICETVITVHGLAGDAPFTFAGGLDLPLRDAIVTHLTSAGFGAGAVTSGRVSGTDPDNICNRGLRRQGVQLEITAAQRLILRTNRRQLAAFAVAVRTATK